MSAPTLNSALAFLNTAGVSTFVIGMETGMVDGTSAILGMNVVEQALNSFHDGLEEIPDSLKRVVSGYCNGNSSARETLQPLVSSLFLENAVLLHRVLRELKAPLAESVAQAFVLTPASAVSQDIQKLHAVLSRKVETLEMSVRLSNSLEYAQIIFIGELVQNSPVNLLKIKNFGRKLLAEVKKLLEDLAKAEGVQLELKMDVHGWQRPTSYHPGPLGAAMR